MTIDQFKFVLTQCSVPTDEWTKVYKIKGFSYETNGVFGVTLEDLYYFDTVTGTIKIKFQIFHEDEYVDATTNVADRYLDMAGVEAVMLGYPTQEDYDSRIYEIFKTPILKELRGK